MRTRSFLQKEQVGRNVTYYVNQRLGSKDQDVFRGFFVEYDIEGAEIKKASAIKKVSERNGGGVEEDEMRPLRRPSGSEGGSEGGAGPSSFHTSKI